MCQGGLQMHTQVDYNNNSVYTGETTKTPSPKRESSLL